MKIKYKFPFLDFILITYILVMPIMFYRLVLSPMIQEGSFSISNYRSEENALSTDMFSDFTIGMLGISVYLLPFLILFVAVLRSRNFPIEIKKNEIITNLGQTYNFQDLLKIKNSIFSSQITLFFKGEKRLKLPILDDKLINELRKINSKFSAFESKTSFLFYRNIRKYVIRVIFIFIILFPHIILMSFRSMATAFAIEADSIVLIKIIEFHIGLKNEITKDDNSINITPLNFSAFAGKEKVLKYLVEKGAEIDKIDHKGRTPLYNSLRREHLSIARFLLTKEANICAKNNENETPKDLLMKLKNAEATELLKEFGRKCNNIE